MISGSSPAGRHRRSARAALVQAAAALGLLLFLALAACSRASGAAGTEEATPESPQEPVVTIAEAVDSMAAEGRLQFLVHAAPAPRADLTVRVSISSDSCTLTRTPDTVTIAAGESRASLTVETSGAAVGAGGCVVTATIADGDGYRAGAAGASASARLTPVQPVVTIAAGDGPVTEGDPVTFTLTAAPPPPASPLTVDVEWDESGSFLTPSPPPTVTIPASGTATLTADTVDDGTDEPDGSVTATVVAGSGYTVGRADSATVEVTDNDPPARSTPRPRVPVVYITVNATHVCEGADAVWTLFAVPAPASSLTVRISLSYSGLRWGHLVPSPIPRAGTVSISSTTGRGSYKMTTVENDVSSDIGHFYLKVEEGEGYLPPPSGSRYEGGRYVGVRIIVVGNEQPSRHCPTVTIAAGASPVTEGNPVTFTLTAASPPPPPASSLTVDVGWKESGSFLTPSPPQTVIIPASGTATLTVDTVDDGTDEPDGSVTATVETGSGYAVGSTGSATVKVTDNDPSSAVDSRAKGSGGDRRG